MEGFPKASRGQCPTDPYPVRVWLGYCLKKFRASDETRQRFYQKTGSVFIPATVQIMAPLGLTAYLPAVMPPDECPSVPDEIALVFYESRDIYHRACTCYVGGRAYAMLHETIFNFRHGNHIPASHSGFPEKFAGRIGSGKVYYYLFDQAVDWQSGDTMVLVGVRRRQDADSFLKKIAEAMTALQKERPEGLDGAVFTVYGDCLVCWTHWATAIPDRKGLLNRHDIGMRVIMLQYSKPVNIPLDISSDYPGIPVKAADSFNCRFARRRPVDGLL